MEYIGEDSLNNVIHYETIQVHKDDIGVHLHEIEKVAHTENKLYFANNKFAGASKTDYATGYTYTLVQKRKSKPE